MTFTIKLILAILLLAWVILTLGSIISSLLKDKKKVWINPTKLQLGISNILMALLLGIFTTPVNKVICEYLQTEQKRVYRAIISDSDNSSVDGVYLEINGSTSRIPSDTEGRVEVELFEYDGFCILCRCKESIDLNIQVKNKDGVTVFQEKKIIPIEDFRDLDKSKNYRPIIISN